MDLPLGERPKYLIIYLIPPYISQVKVSITTNNIAPKISAKADRLGKY